MSPINRKAPFCRLPWSSLAINPNGYVAPCIAANYEKLDFVFGDINLQNFEDVWTGESAKAFRSKHLAEQTVPRACNLCKEIEGKGIKHHRSEIESQYSKKIDSLNINHSDVADPKNIFHLDIAFSSTCNFTCSMCSSKYSTAWRKLDDRFSSMNLISEKQSFTQASDDQKRENLKPIFPYLKNLEHLLIKGGEPLLDPNCSWFLERLVKMGVSSNIHLRIISNGSIYTERLSELFSSYKSVDIVCSVDATGTLFEYIRSGSKCSSAKVFENMRKFQSIGKNVQTIISPTLMAYNVLRIDEIVACLLESGSELRLKNWVITPLYQTFVAIPQDLHPLAAEKLGKAISLLKQYDSKQFSIYYLENFKKYISGKIPLHSPHQNLGFLARLFVEFTREFDKIREQRLADLIPEFEPYFE